MITLEICVDDAEGLKAALEGGADRIELCSALSLGGLTPSSGLMDLARASGPPVYAMIRPRPGNFRYSPAEADQMLRDIDSVRRAGLAGVVFGATDGAGALDEGLLQRLSAEAAGLGLSLHRAFDLLPDDDSALKQAIDLAVALGFERILSSGGASTALLGFARLKRSFALADGRISIMPGAGITASMARLLIDALPLTEIHASCSMALPEPDPAAMALGFALPQRRVTDAASVAALKAVLLA